jgi:hypothetical protein
MTVAPHIVLPALGGLALASASHDDPDTVRWAARQVLAGRARHSLLYEYAAALYECAKALTMIGDKTEASSVRERAAALAQRNGFHELRYRADDLDIEHTRARQRPRVQRDSEIILRELVQSAPSELPEVLVSMGAVD